MSLDINNNKCYICEAINEDRRLTNEVLYYKQFDDLQYTNFVGYKCNYHITYAVYDYEEKEDFLQDNTSSSSNNKNFETKHKNKINEMIRQLNKYIKNNRVFPDIDLLN